ncbi:MAG: thioesterase family protein [Pseudomonadota bacterium]
MMTHLFATLPDRMSARPEPLSRAHFPRFHPIPLRWADVDVYGHVNNAVHYQLFDTAVNGPLVDAGLLDPERGNTVFLVVDSGCSYFRELRFPQTLDAGVRVDRLGRTAVTYSVGLFESGDALAAAQGHFVHVHVDRAARTPVPITEALRAHLTALVPAGEGGDRG